MGVPTSEVGYTSAMSRREDHEVHKDMWGHWGGGITYPETQYRTPYLLTNVHIIDVVKWLLTANWYGLCVSHLVK